MAAATVDTRYVLPLGPVKMEIVYCTGINDTNTVTTQMQNPKFGFGVVNSDGSPMTAAINPSISGRVVTVNSADLAGSNDNLVLVIFGF